MMKLIAGGSSMGSFFWNPRISSETLPGFFQDSSKLTGLLATCKVPVTGGFRVDLLSRYSPVDTCKWLATLSSYSSYCVSLLGLSNFLFLDIFTKDSLVSPIRRILENCLFYRHLGTFIILISIEHSNGLMVIVLAEFTQNSSFAWLNHMVNRLWTICQINRLRWDCLINSV